MKKLNNSLALIFVLATVLSSCQKGPILQINGNSNYSFNEQGGTQALLFSCNRDWFISSSEPWCSVSPSSGTSNEKGTTVTIKCEPNNTYDNRTCILTVNIEGMAERIIVEQEASDALILSKSSFEISSATQTIEVDVQTNVEYAVTIDSDCENWISRVSTKGLSTNKLIFNVFENTEYNERTGNITISQKNGNLKKQITVRQAQKDGLIINDNHYVVSEEAQTIDIQLTTNIEYDVLPEVEWIKYAGTKALSPSTFTLAIEGNQSTFSRSGNVTIKQTNGGLTGTITVIQQPLPEARTEDATSISFFAASLNGELVVESAQEITEEVWFLYSSQVTTIESLKSSGNKVISTLMDDGRFTKEITGLSIATKYYYVACARVNGRDYFGDVKSFTTTDYNAEVKTEKATAIDYFTGTLNGTLDTQNADELTKTVWFLYGSSCTSLEQLQANGEKVQSTLTEDGHFSATLTELNHSTEYYYVACAKVHEKTFYGDVRSFATSSFSATILTSEAISDKLYTATLNASASFDNVGSFARSAGFLYSDRPSTLDQLIEDGTAVSSEIDLENQFKVTISGLQCGIKYNYVAWVKVYDKVFYGDVHSFISYALPDGAVDMGLSVAWASCNIGAGAPEVVGSLYAWGEVETKDAYEWGNYKWGSPSYLTKYNSDPYVGKVDNLVVLEPEDDIAHMKLGGNWRMPTKEQYQELINNCSWSWMEYNGVMGYTVTSNITGNRLFFPVTESKKGEYWTSSHKLRELSTVLFINEIRYNVDYGSSRCEAKPIRAITD